MFTGYAVEAKGEIYTELTAEGISYAVQGFLDSGITEFRVYPVTLVPYTVDSYSITDGVGTERIVFTPRVQGIKLIPYITYDGQEFWVSRHPDITEEFNHDRLEAAKATIEELLALEVFRQNYHA